MMARIAKWMIIGLAVVFVAIQAIRPAKTNQPVDPSQTIYSQVQVPSDVRAVLDRSCRDCHSNQTRWPWYSNVAPVSWFVIDHVNHGRSHMNFSEWSKYDRERSAELLRGICGEVKMGEMPLPSYLWVHHDARMRDGDIGTLCMWGESGPARLSSSSQ